MSGIAASKNQAGIKHYRKKNPLMDSFGGVFYLSIINK
jgi:hypothetical protein